MRQLIAVFVFAVLAGALPMTAAAASKVKTWDGKPVTRSCAASGTRLDSLKAALVAKDYADIGFAHKLRTGYYGVPANARSTLQKMKPAAIVGKLSETLSLLDAGGKRSGLLIYDSGANNGQHALCIWLVTSDGVAAAAVSPLPRLPLGAVTEAALGVYRQMASRAASAVDDQTDEFAALASRQWQDDPFDARTVLRDVADVILPREIADAIVGTGVGRLMILPVNDIGTLPFAALPLGEGQLVDQASVLIVSDLAVFFAKHGRVHDRFREDGPDSLRILAGVSGFWQWPQADLPPLPGVRTEAAAVSGRLATLSLLDGEASRQSVLGLLRGRPEKLQFIYFATHGIADPVNPMDGSYLALSDGPLHARDIKTLQMLLSPLVVMSACQSGLGKVFEGGTFGLARAWMAGGAGQVIMSLWNVSDHATAELMRGFAEALVRSPAGTGRFGGDDPEEALRKAMLLARMADPDPLLWASFTAYGIPSGLAGN